MAKSKKKKYKKKPQQINKQQQVNKNNTTKKPQKEGFFAHRARLKKERERLVKAAAAEAERAEKQARRDEEKARREKLNMERQQANAEAERAKKAIATQKAEPKIALPDEKPANVSVPTEAVPVTAEPVPRFETQVTETVTEPVTEFATETLKEDVIPEPENDKVPAKEYEPRLSEKKEDKKPAPEKETKPAAKSSSKSISSGKKTILLIAVIVLVLVGVFLAVRFGTRGKTHVPEIAVPEYRGAKAHASTVQPISIDAEEESRRIDLLDMKGDKGKFKFYCNISEEMKIEEWYTQFYPCFANSKDNNCDLIITIFDQDGELIYRSLGLTPGKYIPKIKLFGNRDYGVYKCRLCVSAYDPKTFENIGVQYKDFTLLVGIEDENETKQDTTEESTVLQTTQPAETAGTTAAQTAAETTTAATSAATTAATAETTAETASTVSAAS